MPEMASSCLRVLGLAAILTVSLPGSPVAAAGESILSFRSRITVNQDASLTVTESITIQCQQNRIRHGIIREIPTAPQDWWGYFSQANFQVLDVRRDGSQEPYRLESLYHRQKLIIGREDELLAPGVYTYTLTTGLTARSVIRAMSTAFSGLPPATTGFSPLSRPRRR